MIGFLRRWGFRELVLSWIAYWAVLVVVQLGPAIAAIWRATHASSPSSVSANAGDWVLKLVVTSGGRTTWTGSIHLLALAAWIAVPPLVLWALWVASRPRPRAEVRMGERV